jgi:hypothetical protein
MAENPQGGAVLDYFVKSARREPLVLEILDAKGGVVRRYASNDDPAPAPDLQRIQVAADWVSVPEPLSAAAGMHRFAWDVHYAFPRELEGGRRGSRGGSGPWAPPGQYTVRLTRGATVESQPLTLTKDPRLPSAITDLDLVHQYELASDIQAERVRVAVALAQAASLRKQIAAAREHVKGDRVEDLDDLGAAIDRVAGPPIPESGARYLDSDGDDPVMLRRLRSSLSELQSAVESADTAPTPDALTGLAERKKLIASSLARWKELLAADLPKVNRALEAAGLPRLTSPVRDTDPAKPAIP